jgi:hypothetical protein
MTTTVKKRNNVTKKKNNIRMKTRKMRGGATGATNPNTRATNPITSVAQIREIFGSRATETGKLFPEVAKNIKLRTKAIEALRKNIYYQPHELTEEQIREGAERQKKRLDAAALRLQELQQKEANRKLKLDTELRIAREVADRYEKKLAASKLAAEAEELAAELARKRPENVAEITTEGNGRGLKKDNVAEITTEGKDSSTGSTGPKQLIFGMPSEEIDIGSTGPRPIIEIPGITTEDSGTLSTGPTIKLVKPNLYVKPESISEKVNIYTKNQTTGKEYTPEQIRFQKKKNITEFMQQLPNNPVNIPKPQKRSLNPSTWFNPKKSKTTKSKYKQSESEYKPKSL